MKESAGPSKSNPMPNRRAGVVAALKHARTTKEKRTSMRASKLSVSKLSGLLIAVMLCATGAAQAQTKTKTAAEKTAEVRKAIEHFFAMWEAEVTSGLNDRLKAKGITKDALAPFVNSEAGILRGRLVKLPCDGVGADEIHKAADTRVGHVLTNTRTKLELNIEPETCKGSTFTFAKFESSIKAMPK
jgi:hypothetical protein